MNPHRLPHDMFVRLARGGGGPEAVGALRAVQLSKHRLLIRGIVQEARDKDHPHAELAEHAYGLLAQLETLAPRSVTRVVGHPASGAWAWRVYKSMISGVPGPVPGSLGALALAVAADASIALEVKLSLDSDTLMLPSLGLVTVPGLAHEVIAADVRPDGAMAVGGRSVRIDPHSDGPGWQHLRRLRLGDLQLVVDDLDPCRWRDAAALPRLSEAEFRSWQVELGRAWDVLLAGHPGVAAEVRAGLSVITPLPTPAEGHNSGTARDTFGAMALSEPRNTLATAAAFAHEIQHAKLTALLDTVQLVHPDRTARYYAPWRDDPRPLYGLLQGAYAFLGVAGFWRRQRRLDPVDAQAWGETEFARWRQAAFDVAETMLRGSGLTGPGREFVTLMRATLADWCAADVPASALARARADAARHRREWEERNR